ncbi:MAG: M18 family aminopeptidase [Faecalibacterium sp.]|nr:M18 family aminopeptidase [Faecalibacterium sp.]
MQQLLADCFAFLAASPSPYHAVHTAAGLLRAAGFVHLEESAPWALVPGGAYYVTRNGSSLIAWRMPGGKLGGWRGAAAHSDSPAFRLTCTKKEDAYYARAEVEPYGGMRLCSWLDRPLTLAGRILVRSKEGVVSRLIAPERDLLCIPSLCVHFDRDGAKGAPLDPKIDLQPIFGAAGEDLSAVLAGEGGVCPRADILDYDLTLAVRQAPCTVGLENEFFMAPRIDDLACAFGTLTGFLAGTPCETRGDVWCLFDNEEVGSGTRQGALGSFLPDVLARAEAALGLGAEQRIAARANSLFLSADNAHATHPNHPETSDAAHPVVLNGGVVIKYNASQKYTTSGLTGALIAEICRRAEVPVQAFYNRPDTPGGSTLGNLLARQVSVPMADIGLPQLAMHSAVETAGCADIGHLACAAAKFYSSVLTQKTDGSWEIA